MGLGAPRHRSGAVTGSSPAGPDFRVALKTEIKEERLGGHYSIFLLKIGFPSQKHLGLFDSWWMCVECSVEIHADLETFRVSEPICVSRWVYLQRFSFSTVYLPFHLLLMTWRVSITLTVFLGLRAHPDSTLQVCTSRVMSAGASRWLSGLPQDGSGVCRSVRGFGLASRRRNSSRQMQSGFRTAGLHPWSEAGPPHARLVPRPFLVWSLEAPALISLGVSSPCCIPHGNVSHAPRPEVPGPVILLRAPLCPLPRAHTFLGTRVGCSGSQQLPLTPPQGGRLLPSAPRLDSQRSGPRVTQPFARALHPRGPRLVWLGSVSQLPVFSSGLLARPLPPASSAQGEGGRGVPVLLLAPRVQLPCGYCPQGPGPTCL